MVGPSSYSGLLRNRFVVAGILFVASAGNSGRDIDASPRYPAAYPAPNIVAVAATDHNDVLADFSNFGPNSVDLAAPGVAERRRRDDV